MQIERLWSVIQLIQIPSILVSCGFVVKRNITRKKFSYVLGSCSIILAVLSAALLLTILGNAPLIFLRMAETRVGEIDVRLTARNFDQLSRPMLPSLFEMGESFQVNYTQFSEEMSSLPDSDRYSFHSPRYWGYARLLSPRDCGLGPFFEYPPSFVSSCPPEERGTKVHAILLDSEKEERMGSGKDVPDVVLGPGEVAISDALSSLLLRHEGDEYILWRMEWSFVTPLFRALGIRSIPYSIEDPLSKANQKVWRHMPRLILPFKVKKTFSSAAGKVPFLWTENSIFLEYSNFFPYFLPALKTLLQDILGSNSDFNSTSVLSQEVDLNHFAGEIIMNLPPKERLSTYLRNFDNIQKITTSFAGDILYASGFLTLVPRLALLPYLQEYAQMDLILRLVINTILTVLILICVLLLHSFLTASLETRRFEIAVMRMQGGSNLKLTFILMAQALSLVTFAYPIGVLLAQFLCFYFAPRLSKVAGVTIEAWLTVKSLVVSLLLGVFIPILSSISPIRTALGRSLTDNLEVHQSKLKAIQVSVERTDSRHTQGWFHQLDISQIIVGLCFVLFGFCVYYVMPSALLSTKLNLLLLIFLVLLVGMMLGFSLLSLNGQHFIEKAIVFLCYFWENESLQVVLKKNLIAHKHRNQKTFLLYSTGLSFVVFITVSFNIQVQSLAYQSQQARGSYIGLSGENNPITNIAELEDFATLHSDVIDDFAWLSIPLDKVIHQNTKLTNIGHFAGSSINLIAASPNLFDVAIQNPNFVKASDFPADLQRLTFLESLYSVSGISSGIVGSSFADKGFLNLKPGDEFLIEIGQQGGTNETSEETALLSRHVLRLRARGFLDAAPALKLSRFQQGPQDVVISLPSYVALSQGTVQSVDDIPMMAFLLALKWNATDKEMDFLISSLEGLGEGKVWDLREEFQITSEADSMTNFFFEFATVVAMLVCFFSLTSSMYTNILEQSKEISILRAMGTSRFWLCRLYVYEALTVVAASSLTGTLIGMIVSYTMSIQQFLFTQLPIPFVFPYRLLEIVAICSILTSFLATCFPLFKLLRQSIVSLNQFLM